MPFFKCPECQIERETLAPSGVCYVCTEKTEQTRQIEADIPTKTRQLPETITQGSTSDEWADALPPGGYKYDDEPLGQGGMGVVWRAVRESTGETFAIKKLKPESFTPTGIRRFVAEAQTLVRVQHDHVVRLHDFVPDQTDPHLLLEYVPGESLATHIRNVGPLHPRRAARMMAEAAKGVEAAHQKLVVHRDLKPGNLLLTLDGRVKVADFGLCKTLGERDVPALVGATSGGEGNTPHAVSTLTATGRLAGGTPGFMAPEQVSEEFGPVGCAADVWGLGACLHAALTAQAPFPTGKPNMGAVLTESHTPPHELALGVPVELSDIVAKCLTKDPKGRYESAAAVAADLEGYLAGTGTSLRPHSWARRQWRAVRNANRGAVIGVAVAVLAVAVVISFALVPKPAPAPVVTTPPTEPMTPEMIQDEYRRDLKDGKPVTLIGPTGLPRHHRWRMGSSTLVESWHGDGTCAFASISHTYLELLDDPGVDRYIVRAEVRQLASPRGVPAASSGEGDVGLFVGYAFTPAGKGEGVVSLFRLALTDFDPKFHITGNIEEQRVWSAAVAHFVGKDRSTDSYPHAHASALFRPAVKRPGEWRTVEYEVSPQVIVPRWSPDAHPTVPISKRVSLDAGNEYKETQWRVTDVFPAVRVPAWSPRSPLGIYCYSSAVAVRNVVVIPVPER